MGIAGHDGARWVSAAWLAGFELTPVAHLLATPPGLQESFLTECSRLAHLRHPHIITLLGKSELGNLQT